MELTSAVQGPARHRLLFADWERCLHKRGRSPQVSHTSDFSLSFLLLLKRQCGSGSVCFWASMIQIHHYWYGSGSFHHQAKNKRKAWFLLFFDFFMSLKTDVNVPSKSKKQKRTWKPRTKRAGSCSSSGSVTQRYGSADPNTDPEPCQKSWIQNTRKYTCAVPLIHFYVH